MSIYVNTTTLVIELNVGEFLETKVFRLEQGLFLNNYFIKLFGVGLFMCLPNCSHVFKNYFVIVYKLTIRKSLG